METSHISLTVTFAVFNAVTWLFTGPPFFPIDFWCSTTCMAVLHTPGPIRATCTVLCRSAHRLFFLVLSSQVYRVVGCAQWWIGFE
eukprot:5824070-Amphidinium_carterae.2